MDVRIEVLGEEVVARSLLRFADRAQDLSPAMREILDAVRASNARQFDSQGSYGGQPWPANMTSTKESKARLGLDSRVLHATLALRGSLTKQGGANVAVATAHGFVFGSTVPYVGYLREKYKIVSPPERDRRDWVKIVQRFLVSQRP